MIKARIDIGTKELAVLREIMLASPKNTRKRKMARIISAIMAVIMGVCTFVNVLDRTMGHAFIDLAFTIFFVWIIAGGAKFYQDFIYKKVQSKADSKLKSGFREYDFDEDGVTVSSDLGCGLNKWDAFKYWGEFNDFIYLKMIDNRAILVKKSDLSNADCEALRSLLNTHLTQEMTIQ